MSDESPILSGFLQGAQYGEQQKQDRARMAEYHMQQAQIQFQNDLEKQRVLTEAKRANTEALGEQSLAQYRKDENEHRIDAMVSRGMLAAKLEHSKLDSAEIKDLRKQGEVFYLQGQYGEADKYFKRADAMADQLLSGDGASGGKSDPLSKMSDQDLAKTFAGFLQSLPQPSPSLSAPSVKTGGGMQLPAGNTSQAPQPMGGAAVQGANIGAALGGASPTAQPSMWKPSGVTMGPKPGQGVTPRKPDDYILRHMIEGLQRNVSAQTPPPDAPKLVHQLNKMDKESAKIAEQTKAISLQEHTNQMLANSKDLVQRATAANKTADTNTKNALRASLLREAQMQAQERGGHYLEMMAHVQVYRKQAEKIQSELDSSRTENATIKDLLPKMGTGAFSAYAMNNKTQVGKAWTFINNLAGDAYKQYATAETALDKATEAQSKILEATEIGKKQIDDGEAKLHAAQQTDSSKTEADIDVIYNNKEMKLDVAKVAQDQAIQQLAFETSRRGALTIVRDGAKDKADETARRKRIVDKALGISGGIEYQNRTRQSEATRGSIGSADSEPLPTLNIRPGTLPVPTAAQLKAAQEASAPRSRPAPLPKRTAPKKKHLVFDPVTGTVK